MWRQGQCCDVTVARCWRPGALCLAGRVPAWARAQRAGQHCTGRRRRRGASIPRGARVNFRPVDRSQQDGRGGLCDEQPELRLRGAVRDGWEALRRGDERPDGGTVPGQVRATARLQSLRRRPRVLPHLLPPSRGRQRAGACEPAAGHPQLEPPQVCRPVPRGSLHALPAQPVRGRQRAQAPHPGPVLGPPARPIHRQHTQRPHRGHVGRFLGARRAGACRQACSPGPDPTTSGQTSGQACGQTCRERAAAVAVARQGGARAAPGAAAPTAADDRAGGAKRCRAARAGGRGADDGERAAESG